MIRTGGEPHGPVPPTQPDMRVRIWRFVSGEGFPSWLYTFAGAAWARHVVPLFISMPGCTIRERCGSQRSPEESTFR